MKGRKHSNEKYVASTKRAVLSYKQVFFPGEKQPRTRVIQFAPDNAVTVIKVNSLQKEKEKEEEGENNFREKGAAAAGKDEVGSVRQKKRTSYSKQTG